MEKLRTQVLELLQNDWYSNYQINVICKSSSADRIMRFIRKTPPEGFRIAQRKKEMPEGYRKCLEYKLVINAE